MFKFFYWDKCSLWIIMSWYFCDAYICQYLLLKWMFMLNCLIFFVTSTHWCLIKVSDTQQTTFANAFSWMKSQYFDSSFKLTHWSYCSYAQSCWHVCVTRFQWVNTLRLSEAYRHQWTCLSLVQFVACHLCGTKPLPELMLTNWRCYTQWNLNQNFKKWFSRKCFWKPFLQNVSHFVQISAKWWKWMNANNVQNEWQRFTLYLGWEVMKNVYIQ